MVQTQDVYILSVHNTVTCTDKSILLPEYYLIQYKGAEGKYEEGSHHILKGGNVRNLKNRKHKKEDIWKESNNDAINK